MISNSSRRSNVQDGLELRGDRRSIRMDRPNVQQVPRGPAARPPIRKNTVVQEDPQFIKKKPLPHEVGMNLYNVFDTYSFTKWVGQVYAPTREAAKEIAKKQLRQFSPIVSPFRDKNEPMPVLRYQGNDE